MSETLHAGIFRLCIFGLGIDLGGQIVDYSRRSPDSNISRGGSETEEGGHLEGSCERVEDLTYSGIRSQDRMEFD
jgi:hypothetical protein